jgi:hypothetical protein
MPIKGPKTKKNIRKFEEKRMHDFKEGNMHSRVKGTGPVVTDKKQAIAIMLNEAGLSKKKKKK